MEEGRVPPPARVLEDRELVGLADEEPGEILKRWAEQYNKVLCELQPRFSNSEINLFALVTVAKLVKDATDTHGVEYARRNLVAVMEYLATSEQVIWVEAGGEGIIPK